MNEQDMVRPEQTSPIKEFTYNTAAPPSITKKPVELLPLYNEHNPMLKLKMDRFDFARRSEVDPHKLAEQMIHTMKHYGGIGLAAPQCGIPYRMFVMEGDVVCINPSILERSVEVERDREGCLSFPGLFLPITRPSWVRVEYYDAKGERHEQTFIGATARVFQHEYDHLEGIVFTSWVGSLTLQMAKKKKQKLFKKMKRIVEYKQAQMKTNPRR